MNPGWWIRLCDATRDVFRRAPPHLRGRRPHDAGEGAPCPRTVPPTVFEYEALRQDYERRAMAQRPPPTLEEAARLAQWQRRD